MPRTDPCTKALPLWAGAVAARLEFFGTAEAAAALIALHRAVSDHGGAAALGRFLRASLDVVEEQAVKRSDLSAYAADMAELCALARTALNADADDRPLLRRSAALANEPGPICWVADIPGRAVWLAAMAASVPEEEGAAAVMLVNDLAAFDPDLPRQALAAAAGY